MDRTTGENYITVGGKRQFTDGPPGTTITGVHMTAIQEEIASVIEAAGITLSATDNTQLLQAIQNIVNNTNKYGVSGGAADAYTLTVTPDFNLLLAGMTFAFKASFTNTGAATLDVNGKGATTLKKNGGANDLRAGDITTDAIVLVQFDGTNFQVLSVGIMASDLLMNGEATASGASPQTISVGSVKNGDRIFVSIAGDISLTAANPCFFKAACTKSAGTSTGQFENGYASLDVMVSNSVASAFAGIPTTSGVWQVTGDGTLTLAVTASTGGAGVTVNSVAIYVFIMKRV